VVRDGTRISFWHDLWCGDTVLKVAFPVLFGIACAKDAFHLQLIWRSWVVPISGM
jgi:hypothetical protein